MQLPPKYALHLLGVVRDSQFTLCVPSMDMRASTEFYVPNLLLESVSDLTEN